MRYRIDRKQIKMLLDGKGLQAGRMKLYVLKGTQVYTELEKLLADPERLARVNFFTDGISIFVEEKE